MPRPRLTPEIISAASLDAGNASKRRAGRTKWNIDDYNVACAESNRLWAILDTETHGHPLGATTEPTSLDPCERVDALAEAMRRLLAACKDAVRSFDIEDNPMDGCILQEAMDTARRALDKPPDDS